MPPEARGPNAPPVWPLLSRKTLCEPRRNCILISIYVQKMRYRQLIIQVQSKQHYLMLVYAIFNWQFGAPGR